MGFPSGFVGTPPLNPAGIGPLRALRGPAVFPGFPWGFFFGAALAEGLVSASVFFFGGSGARGAARFGIGISNQRTSEEFITSSNGLSKGT